MFAAAPSASRDFPHRSPYAILFHRTHVREHWTQDGAEVSKMTEMTEACQKCQERSPKLDRPLLSFGGAAEMTEVSRMTGRSIKWSDADPSPA